VTAKARGAVRKNRIFQERFRHYAVNSDINKRPFFYDNRYCNCIICVDDPKISMIDITQYPDGNRDARVSRARRCRDDRESGDQSIG